MSAYRALIDSKTYMGIRKEWEMRVERTDGYTTLSKKSKEDSTTDLTEKFELE